MKENGVEEIVEIVEIVMVTISNFQSKYHFVLSYPASGCFLKQIYTRIVRLVNVIRMKQIGFKFNKFSDMVIVQLILDE